MKLRRLRSQGDPAASRGHVTAREQEGLCAAVTMGLMSVAGVLTGCASSPGPSAAPARVEASATPAAVPFALVAAAPQRSAFELELRAGSQKQVIMRHQQHIYLLQFLVGFDFSNET